MNNYYCTLEPVIQSGGTAQYTPFFTCLGQLASDAQSLQEFQVLTLWLNIDWCIRPLIIHRLVTVKLPSQNEFILSRAVTKISSCRVNTTSRRGIKQLGISFGSIFLLFSYESSRGPRS